jgi:hypothetical protein
LFRHLPPSLESELRQRLREATRGPPPHAQAAGLLDLGSGVAVRIVSPGLEAIRAALAEAFEGLLVPQDAAGWRPHVTIQNKVAPAEARALRICLTAGFRRRAISLDGLAVFAYREGLWRPASRHMFRG